MRSTSSALVFVALAASSAGCPGSIDDPSRFMDMQPLPLCAAQLDVPQDIFVMKCGDMICHGNGAASGAGLDLTSPGVAMRLLEVPAVACTGRVLVSTTTVSTSVILDRVSSVPQCGARMPLARPPLSADELTCMNAWVADIVRTATSSGSM